MYRLGFKAWLEEDGSFILSEGRAALLRAVGRRRSLRGAAEELGRMEDPQAAPALQAGRPNFPPNAQRGAPGLTPVR